MSEQFGNILRQARKSAGLSQKALADLVRVSRAAVGQWESGETEPSTENLVLASKILGFGIEDAFNGRLVYISDVKIGELADIDVVVGKTPVSYRDIVKEASRLSQHSELPQNKPAGQIPVFITYPHPNNEKIFITATPLMYAPTVSKDDLDEDVSMIVVGANVLEPDFRSPSIFLARRHPAPSIGDVVVLITNEERVSGEEFGTEKDLLSAYFGRLDGIDGNSLYIAQSNPDRRLSVATSNVHSVRRVTRRLADGPASQS